MNWLTIGSVGLFLSASPLRAENDIPALPNHRADGIRLIFGESDASVHTLRIESEGVGLADTWQTAVMRLFHDLDQDGNQSLNPDEAARLPTGFELRQFLWGNFFPPSGLQHEWESLDQDRDRLLSLKEVEQFYEHQGLGITIGLGLAPATRLNQALLRRLDRDQNQVLAEPEVDELKNLHPTVDLNHDDLITADELVPGSTYPGTAGTTRLQIESPVTASRVSARGVRVLPRESAATCDWHLQFSRAAGPSITMAQPDPCRRSQSVNAPIRAAVRIDPGKLAEQIQKHAAGLRQKFREADVNNEHSLAADNPGLIREPGLRQLLVIRDRNANQRLDTEELESWIAFLQEFSRSQILVTLIDHDCGLFEFLDADHDGRLSLREVRTGPRRLREAAIVDDQVLDWNRLPRYWTVIVSQGHPQRLTALPVRDAPDWFQAMDRNSDGDISRREFLGDEPEFLAFDADQDGLIHFTEARAASNKPAE